MRIDIGGLLGEQRSLEPQILPAIRRPTENFSRKTSHLYKASRSSLTAGVALVPALLARLEGAPGDRGDGMGYSASRRDRLLQRQPLVGQP